MLGTSGRSGPSQAAAGTRRGTVRFWGCQPSPSPHRNSTKKRARVLVCLRGLDGASHQPDKFFSRKSAVTRFRAASHPAHNPRQSQVNAVVLIEMPPRRDVTPTVPGCGGTCSWGTSPCPRAPKDAAGCPQSITGHRGVCKYHPTLPKLGGAP